MSKDIGRVTEAQVRRALLRMDGQVGRRRARIGALVVLATALLAGTLAAGFLFTLADIRTEGMAPALHSGDVVLCEKLRSPLNGEGLARGALALVQYADNGMRRQAVRRVIALAGDEVDVSLDGHVTVNGTALEEPYAVYRQEGEWDNEEAFGGALGNPFASAEDTEELSGGESAAQAAGADDVEFPLAVPEGALFVLCDNREDALDSRSSRFGLVSESDALALPRVVVWPVYRAGALLGGDI